METFCEPREFVENTRYPGDRKDTLAALDIDSIDEPIVDIVAGFATLPHCFSLQCCYGHFVCATEQNPHSLEPIPRDYGGLVRYRIGYIAFCIENSSGGQALRDSLSRITAIDPGYVQFGSPDWFWEQRVNSYALQVEPIAHQLKDEAILEVAEALRTQRARDLFFRELRELMAKEMSAHARG
ncbi:MAG: hypothetical protein HY881_01005 [Deltaproteobacteria bacterium]|nr:hypothetical protein [Deltaproteobacteria bacterium]